jgi:hypothetical protein
MMFVNSYTKNAVKKIQIYILLHTCVLWGKFCKSFLSYGSYICFVLYIFFFPEKYTKGIPQSTLLKSVLNERHGTFIGTSQNLYINDVA